MAEAVGIGLAATIIAIITGIAGLVTGAALSLIGKGKRDQKIDSMLEDHDKKLTSMEASIKNLAAAFSDNGNPRFITGFSCDRSQEKCRAVLIEKFTAGAARFGVIEADIKEIKESQTISLHLILEEIRKTK